MKPMAEAPRDRFILVKDILGNFHVLKFCIRYCSEDDEGYVDCNNVYYYINNLAGWYELPN